MSKFHNNLQAARWLNARTDALIRAGYRSELSGKSSRLEVHHRVSLQDGGDRYSLSNLVVLTQGEHIELHRQKRDVPGAAAWRNLVKDMTNIK